MITFPNCKINVGLYVTGKRADGFHNLETAFFPVAWCDALEVTAHPEKKPFELRATGPVTIGGDGNIIEKACKLLSKKVTVPPLLVYLYKNIPTGAGLGGGSADGAFFLELMNKTFRLGLDKDELKALALELGSDCPFFLENRPVLASGRGEIFTPLPVSLEAYYILVVHPAVHISTAQAFRMITPRQPRYHLLEALSRPVTEWRECVFNDFEEPAGVMFPELVLLKKQLYDAGALYASMSGSGSSHYGIFESEPVIEIDPRYRTFLQRPKPKIL